ncbi:MAG: hypothetical protein AAGJ74_08350 [Pseudomonadota bacterium]
MAIFVLVGTIGIVAFGNTDRWRLQSEAANVALFLQEARIRALETGQPIEIRISGDEGILVAGREQHRFARAVGIDPSAAELVLAPTGQSEGLELSLSRNEHRAIVRLDWLTGRVDVQ